MKSSIKILDLLFNLWVINYESLHKIDNDFDFVIIDETHSILPYPKPSLRTKLIKEKFSNKRILLMSGTPAIESYSQWFHQFWIYFSRLFLNIKISIVGRIFL